MITGSARSVVIVIAQPGPRPIRETKVSPTRSSSQARAQPVTGNLAVSRSVSVMIEPVDGRYSIVRYSLPGTATATLARICRARRSGQRVEFGGHPAAMAAPIC